MQLRLLLIGLIFLTGCVIHGEFGRTDIISDKLEVKPRLEIEDAIRFGVDSLETYDAELENDIRSDNPLVYKEDGKSISFKPTEIRWDDGQSIKDRLSDVRRSKRGERYDYENIYGQGIDLQIKVDPRRFSKVITIDNISRLGSIPGNAKFLEIEFEVNTDFNLPVGIVEEPIELTDLSILEHSIAWDSTISTSDADTGSQTEVNKINIESEVINRSGKIYFVKRLPVNWLQSAQFPIYTDVDITYGSKVDVTLAAGTHVSVTELDTNKFVACYNETSGSDVECRAGTISGNTITLSVFSSTVIDSAAEATASEAFVCTTKLDTDKFLIAWRDADADMSMQVATTSGTTINTESGDRQTGITGGTFGSASLMGSKWCDQLDTDTAAIIYTETSGTDVGEALVASVNSGSSGSTITLGTAVQFEAGNTRFPTVCRVTTDEQTFAVLYEDQDDSDIGKVVIATSTGTTINGFTTPTAFGTDQINDVLPNCTAIDDDKVAYAWLNQDGTSEVSNRVLTIDNDENITFGTEVDLSSGNSRNINTKKIDTTRYVVALQDSGTQGESYLNSVSGTTITAGSPETFDTNNVGDQLNEGMSVDLTDTNEIVICYSDVTQADISCIAGEVAEAVTDTNPANVDFWLKSGQAILKQGQIIIKQ